MHFSMQNNNDGFDDVNHNTHVGPVELSESETQEQDFSENDNPSMVKSQACSEFRVINQENLPSREKEIENPQIIHTLPPTGFKFEEVNDIRQIEEELNRAKFALEEPSPAKLDEFGPYHNNMVNTDMKENQSPMIPKMDKIHTSNSHPMFKLATSAASTNFGFENKGLRASGHNPTPKNYNFALNDQISMFSSQDKRNTMTQKMNTSDIVEYNRDFPSQRPPYGSYADTLERDVSQFGNEQHMYTTRTDPMAHYHSFNPDGPKTVTAETYDHTKTDCKMVEEDNGFSFDKKNLFSIDDLHKVPPKPQNTFSVQQESKSKTPFQEIKNQDISNTDIQDDATSAKPVKKLKLPKTNFKAQKHKNLIDESKKFNLNRISADSPVRANPSKKPVQAMAVTQSNNGPFGVCNTSIMKRGLLMPSVCNLTSTHKCFKFIHTSLPFCEIPFGDDPNTPLQEMNIFWKKGQD